MVLLPCAPPLLPRLPQVDGCTIEVGAMKDYHSRYKICEVHLKASVVQKGGQPHRFCQQCGKFQSLEDFDGEKRSCRARLDKHNARRRRQREMAHMLKKTGTVDEKLLAEKCVKLAFASLALCARIHVDLAGFVWLTLVCMHDRSQVGSQLWHEQQHVRLLTNTNLPACLPCTATGMG